jgi:hypothetical protein
VEILKHAFGGVKTLFGNVLLNVLKIAESTGVRVQIDSRARPTTFSGIDLKLTESLRDLF